ncbi:MAG TPA: hypothetical protein VGF94_17355 [Kofleriaceae bacterium]
MTRVLVVLAVLAGTARADDVDPGMLGFRFAGGTLPVDGARVANESLAIGVEHELACGLRGFGEYEWMWLAHDETALGDGSRIQLGLRHVIAQKRLSMVRLFVDGEVGGGAALVTDVGTVHLLPDAFVGARFGYDLLPHTARSPSRTFEPELSVRVLALPGGAAWMVGVGAFWGG